MSKSAEASLRDLSPLEASYACEQFRSPIQKLSRSSTLSTLADETDTLWDAASPQDDYGKSLEKQYPAQALRSPRGSWFAKVWTAIVLLTSLYSTALSGIYFILAVTSYQYDIGHRGTLSLSNLSTLIAAGSKTIELSFELVSVAVVGQELTRRLTTRSCNGINLAEMQLKAFLAQPGSMITNWQALLHIAPSYLGFICLFIAAISILYTTASNALVSPTAVMTSMGIQHIPTSVDTAFINTTYIQRTCPAQVTLNQDPNALSACDNVQQTGFVFRNLMRYLDDFEVFAAFDGGEKNLTLVSNRPGPVALFNDLSTVNGQWLQGNDTNSEHVVFQQSGRTVNNVTMLLPHAGVVAAAQSFVENLAPQDQNGAGQLYLSASVTTPAINVLCASFDADDPTLSAIVVPEWSAAQNASVTPNMSYVLNATAEFVREGWYNGSDFDTLWKFSPSHRPPVFPNLPGPNNTRISWSQTTNGTAYLLGRTPDDELFMCSMTSMLVHGCSTIYHSTLTGGELDLDCTANNPMAYQSSHIPAPAQLGFVPAANAWSLSLSLGSASDGDGSLARMLTQLWPASGTWNSSKPSMAETLAILAGSLVLNGAVGAPLGDTNEHGLPVDAASMIMTAAATARTKSSPLVDPASATATASVLNQKTSIPTGAATNSAIYSLIAMQSVATSMLGSGAASATTATATPAPTNHTGSNDKVELQRRDDAPTTTLVAGPPQPTAFPATVKVSVYSAGSNTGSQAGWFVVLMGAWFLNCLFLVYTIATLVARRRSTAEDLGADAEGAGTWTLRADLADPQALFGLALNSNPDERLADATLAPLPRKAMSQRWRVAGDKRSVFIHPIGRRKSSLRRAVSSAVSTVGSVTRKKPWLRKEMITRNKEFE